MTIFRAMSAAATGFSAAIFLAPMVASAAPEPAEQSVTGSGRVKAAVPGVVQGPEVYSPQPGVLFNDPTGTMSERYVIATHINKSIDATPAGGTIRIATYSFTFNNTVDKLIAARARGASVRVLIDNRKTSPETARLARALGSDTRRGSFVKRCRYSCMSREPSLMHAKLYTFSQAGSSRLVSMMGSANLAFSSAPSSWNNLHTLVGDATVYNSLNRYFDDMLRDVHNPNYYRSTSSGAHRVFFLPKADTGGVDNTAIMGALNQVSCTGAAAGYGNQGRTVIRVGMYHWSASQADIAEKLNQLRGRGCDVQVVTNVPIAATSVMKALLRRSSRYGVMPVYDALTDKDRDGTPERYVHHKAVIINGKLANNPRAKVVYSGSQNFTANSVHRNNEILFRVSRAATCDAYLANLATIRDRHTRRVSSASDHRMSETIVRKLIAAE